jgi:hypothetical protein
MGTNYYIRDYSKSDYCPHCERGDKYKEIHIGKSSGGWKFLFNGEDFKSIKQVERTLAKHFDELYDEYDRKVDRLEFWEMVERKQSGKLHEHCDPNLYFYDHGYDFMNRYFC